MSGNASRMALGAAALSLAVLCAGCAWLERPGPTSQMDFPASNAQAAPASVIALSPPVSLPDDDARPLPALSNEPEHFACLDGSSIRISYPTGRDVVSVSLDGARPMSMRREDESGLTTYRAESLVLRRSGVRVALASDLSSVRVQAGDTLGSIAIRAYGDRTRAIEIARLNNLENPNLIFPGQVLTLPQMERRCRRAQIQEASHEASASGQASLNRRRFTPPSERQFDLRRVRATTSDRTRN